jgi:hypothetical protein
MYEMDGRGKPFLPRPILSAVTIVELKIVRSLRRCGLEISNKKYVLKKE